MSRPPTRHGHAGSQRWLIPTVALFVVLPVAAGVAAAVSAWRGDRGPSLSREGSVEVDSSSPVHVTRTPVTYRVRYSVERFDKDGVDRSEELYEVRRPFDARVTTFRAGRVVDRRVSRLGTLVLTTGDGARTLVSPPAPATGDLRPAEALPRAVDTGALQVREQREVLGRRCQVYRAGATITAGDLTPVHTTPGEHADFCLDEAGLVLEEVWFTDGEPLRRRIATLVEEDVALADTLFSLPGEQPIDAAVGAGFFRRIDPATGFEGSMFTLPSPPPGAEHVGRFVVQPPSLSPTAGAPGADPRPEQVSVVDVWRRGADMVTLYQTIAADLSAVPPDSKTMGQVDLGGSLGKATTLLDLRANEVRLELPEARFVRLIGTLSLDDLVALARTLEPVEGRPLVLLDE